MNHGDHKTDEFALDSIAASVEKEFESKFGRPPTLVVAAPGRVNLIGEHVDYNDGFVMPMALDRYIVIAAAPSDADVIRLHSTTLNTTDTIQLDQPIQPGRKGWVTYVEGVLAGFVELGKKIPAFDAMVGSSVPQGGGLSSSAALEVAVATLMEELTGHKLELLDKALLCQKAEQVFAGVPCGIMDQYSSTFGETDRLMLIDCRSNELTPVPFVADDISVLIANSNVKHELTGGEYAERRAQCDSALAKLPQSTWRDVTMDDVEKARESMSDEEFRRARHVVTEIARTTDAAEAFRNSDWETAGKLMYESHASLRDDFEVSCKELDVLVEIASEIGSAGGVIGSRMTGGGFGGCTVSLVKNDQIASVMETLKTQYESRTGIKPQCFSSKPSRGAHVIKS